MEQEMCNQKQNSDKTKENQRNHHKKLKTHRERATARTTPKNKTIKLKCSLNRQKKKKKQVFPKHTTNLETLKLSLTKKISSLQNYTKP
jgi:hypothetical protein